MTDFVFKFGNEFVALRYEGKRLQFCKQQGNFYMIAPFDELKLSLNGILKEFPDLEGRPLIEIRKEAIARFKEKIKNMKNEEEVEIYLINDLKDYGYKPYMKIKKGYRPVRYGN